MTTKAPSLRFVLTAALAVLILAIAPVAFAGRGGGGGGGKKPGGGTPQSGSFSLVQVDPPADGLAHWGHHITFNATSTATYYFVAVTCSQGGVPVYRQDIGFYVGWPWSQNFTLMSYAWTGGAADCNAVLYSQNSDGSSNQTLATMSFPVAA